ncbi:Aspartic proteinase-like protein 2 [Platanthera zijinensis]|uniref:Aspartic proteinase-like protein 2 n=1 Tax=Platanthera zijinensis TaxID=2320716 RepID=A0AAP0G1U5_9ASPA
MPCGHNFVAARCGQPSGHAWTPVLLWISGRMHWTVTPDMVLSNKLVIYDLENQVVGWTDYNCSSSIKIEDDKTARIYTVDAQNLSPAARSSEIGRLLAFLMLACFMFNQLH